MSLDPIKIRINIAGYSGSPTSLYCAFDPATDVLLVARAGEYDGSIRDGFLKITNVNSDQSLDMVFDPDQTKEAIEAYFEMDSMRLLNMGEAVQRFNPSAQIERDGMDESGPKYRVAPGINSGQVAVLVACLVARMQRRHVLASEAFRDFELLTI